MKIERRQTLTAILLMVFIVLVDQCIKIYIKTHFVLHESVKVTSWFYLSFVENNGMAYGVELGSKTMLTIFRIVAVAAFLWVLFRKINHKCAWSFVVLMSMIISGAVGNIIDSVFYGQWFTSSVGRVAQWSDASVGLMPQADWFNGRVVDMFYFPLIDFDWPSWVPTMGETVHCIVDFEWPRWLPCSDEPFRFFEPVFNFADASISVGVALLLIYLVVESRKEAKAEAKAKGQSESADHA